MIILYQNVGDTVVITQVKPVWTLGKEKLFLAGNTSEIKIIEKYDTSSLNKSPKRVKNIVKNEKIANIEIKNQSTHDIYKFPHNLKTSESTLGTGMITRDNNNNIIISQMKDPFICLRDGISNTTDLDSNPFIIKTSPSSIFSPEKKHRQVQTRLEDDDIEVKKEITFLFTIIGWQDTTTGVEKKYEKIIEEKSNTDNVGLEVEVEVDVEVEVEKKSKRKSFGNNKFKTILKRNSTDKKITRLSCLPQEKNIKVINKKEDINISNISIIEIHGVNEDTKVSILFEYKIYTVLLPYLLNDWLEPGKEIEVYYGLITEIDKSHDFIRILRSEHTIVKEKCNTIYNCNEKSSSAITTKNKNYNFNNNTPYNEKNSNNDINEKTSYKHKNNDYNNNHDNKENKKENYNRKIESSDVNKNCSKNDNNDANNKNNTSTKIAQNENSNSNKDKIENNDNDISDSTIGQQRMFRNNILENDRNRYDALGQNKTEFQNVSNNTMESCLRHRINNAYVLIKTDTKKMNQNLEPTENKCQDSSLERTDDTGTFGTFGYELSIKEVPKENGEEHSIGSMMTCESDEALLESEEQQQQQQQQQQQRDIQSITQVNSKKRLLDSRIPCGNNILPDSTESYRPYRQEIVTLTVSKDNKTEIMEIEHSLLPEELQYDFQQDGKNANNQDNHVNGCHMYDIVFARTWTSSSSMSSSSEDNLKTIIPSSHVHSTVISTSAIDHYKINRESSTSASSEEQNFYKKECCNPKWKIIWMKQKL